MIKEDLVNKIAYEHRSELVGYAYLLCASISEADDITEGACVRVLRRRAAPTTLNSALAEIKSEIVADVMARSRRRAAELSPRMVDVSPMEPRSREPWLGAYGVAKELLAEFTVAQRACVVLTFVDGLTLSEAATALALSEGTVGRYLDKALARMRSATGTDTEAAVELAFARGAA